MKTKHIYFAFMLAWVVPVAPAVSAPSAEVQRAEALKKEQRQLDAALAKHTKIMKALEEKSKVKPKIMP